MTRTSKRNQIYSGLVHNKSNKMTDVSTPHKRSGSRSGSRSRSRSRSKGRHNSEDKPIRAWCPGSFDFLHLQQINFLRKVKHELGTRFPKVELVVGLYSDYDLISRGRAPVFSLNERFEMVKANKWVDKVVKDAPLEISNNVLKANSCDYAFFSDNVEEVSTPEFDDQKNELLESGLLKRIPAEKDDFSKISSNDLINRILLREPKDENNNTLSGKTWDPEKLTFPFGISFREVLAFSSGKKPKPTDKIVYVDGAFDLLTPDHLSVLEKASRLGDFLYVGLHSDQDISKYAGEDFPVMKWNERLMALLACRYVSDVIIDAPVKITESLLKEFGIEFVVHSSLAYDYDDDDDNRNLNRYDVAKQKGILVEILADKRVADEEDKNTSDVTPVSEVKAEQEILNRVHQNWQLYA